MIIFANNYYCEFCFEKMNPAMGICPKCGSQYNAHNIPGVLPQGTILAGRYYVGKLLGKGGFGRTYLCLDMRTCMKVAVKEYFPEDYAHRNTGGKIVYPKHDPKIFKQGAKRFYREAKILARFRNNPEIVKVIEMFEENNTAYYAMEYLSGRDLKTYFRDTPHPEENFIAFIACKVLEGLKTIHSSNVLHRDIAPDNIFICDDGTIKLIDFGASRITIGTVTNSMALVVKPGFAPFEQYQTKGNQGPWTDIYALGATIYYILKRKVPPDAISRYSDDTLDMSGISPYLARIILKMMALSVDNRYKSADDVIRDLIRFQTINVKHDVVVNQENNNIYSSEISFKSSGIPGISKILKASKNNPSAESKNNVRVKIAVCVASILLYILFCIIIFNLFK